MAIGPMGIAAPVTAVLSASVPVVVGTLTQGPSGPWRLLGFTLALASIWLLTRPAAAAARPAGLGLAVGAGLGFGGFLLSIAQVQARAVFWPLVAARSAGIVLLVLLALTGRPLARPAPSAHLPIGLAGAMDAAGNALFVLAARAGRLDVAGTLASLYPATTVLLALLILRERLRRPQGAGLLLALIAVPLIAG